MKFLPLSSALVSLLAAVGEAVPAASKHHVLHERRDGLHPAWRVRSRAPADYVIPLRIGLKQRNLEHADRYIMDVADPASPNFGRHWSAREVAEMFAPSAETAASARAWLIESGISAERMKLSNGRNWVEVDVTVEEAEMLLDTQYHVYVHEDGTARVACDSYGLPGHVREHIDFVMPTVQLDAMQATKNRVPPHTMFPFHFPPGGPFKPPYGGGPGKGGGGGGGGSGSGSGGGSSNDTDLSICASLITIDCLRALYNFPAGTTAHPGNEIGIAEWADYLYLPDLAIFFQNWTNPPIPADVTPEFVSIDGGRPSNLSAAEAGEVIESALDFQTAYSIVYPQGARLYQNGDGVNVDSVGTFNIFLDALDASFCDYQGGDAPYVDPQYPDPNIGGFTGPLQCGGAPFSNVVSVSYGQIEGALPVFYQQRQCFEWGKMALQGMSVIYASGDSGVANRYNAGFSNSCLNAKYGYVDSNGTKFSPSFPGNCPYVTTVGATQLKGATVEEGEVAVNQPDPSDPLNDFFSGGGFSNVFGTPSWQASAVRGYLAHHDPGYGPEVFNRSGRGFPDVAAMGLNVTTVWLDRTLGVGGTSASAPIFAAIVTLLNEERLSAGKGPIGYLNPTLYAHPDMFNDITEGGNPGCGTDGFAAAPGWDPVTGLGTPNYEKMKSVFLSLP